MLCVCWSDTGLLHESHRFIQHRPPSSLHALSTTRTTACRRLGWLSGTFRLKAVQRINTSLQFCMGTCMLFAKLRHSVHTATRLCSLNGSLCCSCSPWHAIVNQRATPWAACIRAWSKRCCVNKVEWTCGTGCACAGAAAASGNNELRPGAPLLDSTVIGGGGNRSLTSGLGAPIA